MSDTRHRHIIVIMPTVLLLTLAAACHDLNGAVDCLSDSDCGSMGTCTNGVCEAGDTTQPSDADTDTDTDVDTDTDADIDTINPAKRDSAKDTVTGAPSGPDAGTGGGADTGEVFDNQTCSGASFVCVVTNSDCWSMSGAVLPNFSCAAGICCSIISLTSTDEDGICDGECVAHSECGGPNFPDMAPVWNGTCENGAVCCVGTSEPIDTDTQGCVMMPEPSNDYPDEGCCSDPGVQKECWLHGAQMDGIACDEEHENCLSGSCDYKRGVCECSRQSDCNDAQDRKGYCNVDAGYCGPSFCNGFSFCSCWGGCTEGTIPDLEANEKCCEGRYSIHPDDWEDDWQVTNTPNEVATDTDVDASTGGVDAGKR